MSMERRMANMHYEFSNIIDNVVIPTVWKVDGLSKNERVICEYMNECQKRRAEELDRAIQILRSHTN